MSSPKVFISYSWDSDEHHKWVGRLGEELRRNGVDVILDQWDLELGQDVSLFMQRGVASSDKVILVCTPKYIEKADGGTGGVGYERLVITNEVVGQIDTRKFLPIMVGWGAEPPRCPTFLGPRKWVSLDDGNDREKGIDELVRSIFGHSPLPKPALGPAPAFSATLPLQNTSSRQVPLEDPWFAERQAEAVAGATAVGVTGQMAVWCAPQAPISRSLIQLRAAAKESTIHTFGWPIGVFFESDHPSSPKPMSYGIRAEVPLKSDESFVGRQSYDMWAMRTNGDVAIYGSYFEDMRGKSGEHRLFFNTRIVRVAEVFMYLRNLYSRLGISEDAVLSTRFDFSGLQGRSLSSVGARHWSPFPRKCSQSNAEIAVEWRTADADHDLTSLVSRVCDPLFMLFDFTEVSPDVTSDIVDRFRRGEVT